MVQGLLNVRGENISMNKKNSYEGVTSLRSLLLTSQNNAVRPEKGRNVFLLKTVLNTDCVKVLLHRFILATICQAVSAVLLL